jgi:transposase
MVTLTRQAEQQLMVLNALERGDLLVAEAAGLLDRSVRQTQRLRAAYRQHGATALVHGNRGRPSPRRINDATRRRLVTLAQTTYAQINYQHLSELLAEREALRLSRPTIHRILRQAGLRSPRRRRPPKHRQRRERMPRAGMLMQMDGSQHLWLEDRGPALVLLHAVDDATGTVLGAVFRQQEDAHGYLLLLRQIATTHGLPLAAYTDRHGIFARSKRAPLTVEEQLRGNPPPTHVGRALQELGIQWIPASSPQAKGRIERQGGTLQDRLVTELRLAGIRDLASANAFLPRFVTRYNVRFAQPPAITRSAYRPWPTTLDPETVFCFKYLRTVANDNTVTLAPHSLQLLSSSPRRSYARATVEVHERLDGTLAVFYQSRRLAAHTVTPPAKGVIPARHDRRAKPPGPGSVQALRAQRRRRGQSPTRSAAAAPDHLWRQMPPVTPKRLKPEEGTNLLNA